MESVEPNSASKLRKRKSFTEQIFGDRFVSMALGFGRTPGPSQSQSGVKQVNNQATRKSLRKFKRLADITMLLVIIVDSFTISLRVAFHLPPLWWWWVVDVGSDIVYCFDMYLQFRMPRWIKGQLVFDRPLLMADYLRFSVPSFYSDLVFSFPFDLLFIAVTGDRSTAACIRLMRLYRLFKLYQIFKQIEEEAFLNRVKVQLVKFVVCVLFLLHATGCGWFLMARVEGYPDNGWAPSLQLQENALVKRYVVAVLWALNGVAHPSYLGSDFAPDTNAECVYVLCVLLVALFSWSAVLSISGRLLQSMGGGRDAKRCRIQGVKQYLAQCNVSPALQERVLNYCKYMWTEDRDGGKDEASLPSDLPVFLLDEVAQEKAQDIIGQLPLFANLRPSLKAGLALQLHRVVIVPGDVIVQEEDMGEEMYFISKGRVRVTRASMHDGSPVFVAELGAGSFFGELSVLFQQRRSASVTALTHVELFCVTREGLELAFSDAPEDLEVLAEIARLRHAMLADDPQEAMRLRTIALDRFRVEVEPKIGASASAFPSTSSASPSATNGGVGPTKDEPSMTSTGMGQLGVEPPSPLTPPTPVTPPTPSDGSFLSNTRKGLKRFDSSALLTGAGGRVGGELPTIAMKPNSPQRPGEGSRLGFRPTRLVEGVEENKAFGFRRGLGVEEKSSLSSPSRSRGMVGAGADSTRIRPGRSSRAAPQPTNGWDHAEEDPTAGGTGFDSMFDVSIGKEDSSEMATAPLLSFQVRELSKPPSNPAEDSAPPKSLPRQFSAPLARGNLPAQSPLIKQISRRKMVRSRSEQRSTVKPQEEPSTSSGGMLSAHNILMSASRVGSSVGLKPGWAEGKLPSLHLRGKPTSTATTGIGATVPSKATSDSGSSKGANPIRKTVGGLLRMFSSEKYFPDDEGSISSPLSASFKAQSRMSKRNVEEKDDGSMFGGEDSSAPGSGHTHVRGLIGTGRGLIGNTIGGRGGLLPPSPRSMAAAAGRSLSSKSSRNRSSRNSTRKWSWREDDHSSDGSSVVSAPCRATPVKRSSSKKRGSDSSISNAASTRSISLRRGSKGINRAKGSRSLTGRRRTSRRRRSDQPLLRRPTSARSAADRGSFRSITASDGGGAGDSSMKGTILQLLAASGYDVHGGGQVGAIAAQLASVIAGESQIAIPVVETVRSIPAQLEDPKKNSVQVQNPEPMRAIAQATTSKLLNLQHQFETATEMRRAELARAGADIGRSMDGLMGALAKLDQVLDKREAGGN